MKSKGFFFCILCLALLICNACEEPISSNPKEDKTELWPAADASGERFGFINKKGEMIIPAQYQMAYCFSGGVATVVTDDYRVLFINKKGKVVYTLPHGYNCDQYICNGGRRFYSYYGIYGMYDEHFNVIIPELVANRELGPMSREGLILFRNLHEEGFYNRKGEVVLYNPFDSINGRPKEYSYADDSFHEGIEIVSSHNGLQGAINTHGELVIDTTYIHLHYAGSGLFAYRLLLGGDYHFYGLMDVGGNILTEPIYKDVYYEADGDNGLVPISDENSNVCYVDKTGAKVLRTSFIGYSYPFHEGVAWANIHDPSDNTIRYVLLDTEGNILWKLKKDGRPLSSMHNGLCVIEEDSIVKYVDKSKNCVYSSKRPRYSPFAPLNPLLAPAKNEHN